MGDELAFLDKLDEVGRDLRRWNASPAPASSSPISSEGYSVWRQRTAALESALREALGNGMRPRRRG